MRVQAVTGLKVPMENKPRDYITDAEAMEVPNTAYYQRRLSEGDLVLADAPVKAAKSVKTAA